MPEHPSPERILQTGLAFWASKTLLGAIEMGLFTELSRGPEPFDGISGRLGLHPRSTRDLLDVLPKAGVVLRGHILHDWDLPTKTATRVEPLGGPELMVVGIK